MAAVANPLLAEAPVTVPSQAALPWLYSQRILSRGRFGAWKYEVRGGLRVGGSDRWPNVAIR